MVDFGLIFGPHVLGRPSMVRPKRPTILIQPSNKFSLFCETWRNLLLTADINNFKNSVHWVNFGLFFGPPGTQLGLRPKRPTLTSQPTEKISLLCGAWRNLPLTGDIKKLQKSVHLVNLGLIFGPPGTRLGLPGLSKTAFNNKSN